MLEHRFARDVTGHGVRKAAVNRAHSKGFATPDALEVAKRLECACLSTALRGTAPITVFEKRR